METTLQGSVAGLVPAAIEALNKYMASDEGDRASRDRARMALSIVNTAVTVQRAQWTQERFHASVAKTLADGDLNAFQSFVQGAMPGFPTIRKGELPTTTT